MLGICCAILNGTDCAIGRGTQQRGDFVQICRGAVSTRRSGPFVFRCFFLSCQENFRIPGENFYGRILLFLSFRDLQPPINLFFD